MKIVIRNFILILIALSVCVLYFKQTKKEKDFEAEKTLVVQKNEKFVKELSDKYSIKYCLDTLHYDYSIQSEDMLKTKYQLIRGFRIQDIYIQDSISYVKAENGTFYLNLKIDKTELEKLLTHINLDMFRYSYQVEYIMIVNLEEIKKIDFAFESYPEYQEEYCSIEIESSNIFVGKGRIIEVQILNEL